MNVVCTYIKKEVIKKFNMEVGVFISKKKKEEKVDFAFDESLVS